MWIEQQVAPDVQHTKQVAGKLTTSSCSSAAAGEKAARSTDLSLGPDPAKVGTSMDELIRAVNGSAARATKEGRRRHGLGARVGVAAVRRGARDGGGPAAGGLPGELT
eukprot:scaffold37915_cov34-Phaeocystis_antarctica.AAC.1